MASRGHRLSIYNPQFKVAGVAIGSHKVFGQMVVVNLCAEFEPDAGKIQARKQSGPPARGRHGGSKCIGHGEDGEEEDQDQDAGQASVDLPLCIAHIYIY